MNCLLTDVEPLGRVTSMVSQAIVRHGILYRGRICETPLVLAQARPTQYSFAAFSGLAPVELTKPARLGDFLLVDVVAGA